VKNILEKEQFLIFLFKAASDFWPRFYKRKIPFDSVLVCPTSVLGALVNLFCAISGQSTIPKKMDRKKVFYLMVKKK